MYDDPELLSPWVLILIANTQSSEKPVFSFKNFPPPPSAGRCFLFLLFFASLFNMCAEIGTFSFQFTPFPGLMQAAMEKRAQFFQSLH